MLSLPSIKPKSPFEIPAKSSASEEPPVAENFEESDLFLKMHEYAASLFAFLEQVTSIGSDLALIKLKSEFSNEPPTRTQDINTISINELMLGSFFFLAALRFEFFNS